VWERHFCFGVAPPLWDLVFDHRVVHSTGFELNLHLLLIGIRLGFNPGYLADMRRAPPQTEPYYDY
jgi:hypothetical protein